MPDDQLQTLKWLAFGGLDPNVGYNRQPAEGRMVDAASVRVLGDGSLKWCRDQFYIHDKGNTTVASLWEFKNSTHNQLLAFATDGGLYYLDTDWANETPTQWSRGYELFRGKTWSSLNTSGEPSTGETGGCFALAEHDEYLYILRSAARMRRWDGAHLGDVGLLSPFSPPTVGDKENFTSTSTVWTEIDPSSHITVAANRITATDMTADDGGYVYRDMGAAGIRDFDFRFTLYNGGGSNDGGPVCILGFSNVVGTGQNWNPGLHLFAANGGIYLYDWTDAPTLPEAARAAAPGTYYCRITREGNTVTLHVSSSADMSDPTTGSMITSARAYRYLYVMAGWGSGGPDHDTWSGYIEDLYLGIHPGTAGQMTAGTYRSVVTFEEVDSNGLTVWESVPSEPSAPIVIGDNESITWVKIPAPPAPSIYGNTVYRKLYRASSPSTDDGAQVGAYRLVARLEGARATSYEDNTPDAQLGDTFDCDYAVPPYGKELCAHNERFFMARVTQTSESYTRGLYYDPNAPYTTGLDNKVYYSELDAPWYWPTENVLTVGDSNPVVGLVSWREHLLIFKPNGVWVFTGWDETSFDLNFLDSHGLCAYRAYATCGEGVMWASTEGLMWFDGSKVMKLASFVEGALTRPTFADGEAPKMAYANGRMYFKSGTDLYWLEPGTAVWGRDSHGPIGTGGIYGFQRGDKQSHLLCRRYWHTSTSDLPEITVLHTEEAFPNFNADGPTGSDYRAPISIIFAPITPDPDEEIILHEVWVDGTFTSTGLAANDPHVYYSDDDMATWTDLGAMPVSNGKLTCSQAVRGKPLYLKIEATKAPDFMLRAIKLYITRRQPRGTQTA